MSSAHSFGLSDRYRKIHTSYQKWMNARNSRWRILNNKIQYFILPNTLKLNFNNKILIFWIHIYKGGSSSWNSLSWCAPVKSLLQSSKRIQWKVIRIFSHKEKLEWKTCSVIKNYFKKFRLVRMEWDGEKSFYRYK